MSSERHDDCTASHAIGRHMTPGGETSEMSGKTDQVKGRVKEAAGVLAGDKTLERKGKIDRAAGNIKEKVGNVVDHAKKKTEEVVEKAKSTINRKP